MNIVNYKFQIQYSLYDKLIQYEKVFLMKTEILDSIKEDKNTEIGEVKKFKDLKVESVNY